jgi:hypothetical protein
MALSMKNTIISLSLSGLMLFAGFLAGEQPANAESSLNVTQVSASTQVNKNALFTTEHTKKAKRSFTTPYFSFKKSSLPVRVR